ncbi:MAG: CYTH domain-containing protein [Bacteroidales bacterium]|nr:CYTH domain-containing protein [Bacteroidales bacterium]
MAKEIERKFLVSGDFRSASAGVERIVQGYLCSDPERTVRVRIKGQKAFLTIKGRSTADGLSRYEWEKEIQVAEAEELLKLCERGVIEKDRYMVPVQGHVFEVDVFYGENQGLVMAELELSDESESFHRPEWLGDEVTGDLRYYNSMLRNKPYTKWNK